MYIVLDGIDGCGKDTQADLLKEVLETVSPVLRINEPYEKNPVGVILRKLLKSGEHQVAHPPLFLANRLALQYEVIIPALDEGFSIISARSFLSTLVYQQEHWSLNDLFSMHEVLPVQPDYLLILDLDPEEALKRVTSRSGEKECYERQDIQARNRRRYKDMIQDPRLQEMVSEDIVLIDASGSPLQVHKRILETLPHG